MCHALIRFKLKLIRRLKIDFRNSLSVLDMESFFSGQSQFSAEHLDIHVCVCERVRVVKK